MGASGGFLRSIIAAWLGGILALITYAFITGQGGKTTSALSKFFGNMEKYGTFSPADLARVNEPEDSVYEFPMQSNNSRRPARINNRTVPAVYPTSGSPSMLPSAPLSATARPGGVAAAAYEANIWDDISPGVSAFDGTLMSDLLPSETAAPVRTLEDSYRTRFAGTASRVPVDS